MPSVADLTAAIANARSKRDRSRDNLVAIDAEIATLSAQLAERRALDARMAPPTLDTPPPADPQPTNQPKEKEKQRKKEATP